MHTGFFCVRVRLLLPAGRLLKGAWLERTLGAGYLRACADLQSSERIGMSFERARG